MSAVADPVEIWWRYSAVRYGATVVYRVYGSGTVVDELETRIFMNYMCSGADSCNLKTDAFWQTHHETRRDV